MWWHALMEWLPDLRVGTFEIRDVLNLLMTGLGAALAGMAIRMGSKQSRIGREQMAIALRQEALDVQQMEIAKRQGEIAERQHKVLEDQLDRRVNLVMSLSPAPLENPDLERWNVVVVNNGNRTARDFHWELYVPWDLRLHHELRASMVQRDVPMFLDQSERPYFQISGHVAMPVHPKRRLNLGHVTFPSVEPTEDIDKPSPDAIDVQFRWLIDAEDGLFPSGDGYGTMSVLEAWTDQLEP
jgi:hypothetical protein